MATKMIIKTALNERDARLRLEQATVPENAGIKQLFNEEKKLVGRIENSKIFVRRKIRYQAFALPEVKGSIERCESGQTHLCLVMKSHPIAFILAFGVPAILWVAGISIWLVVTSGFILLILSVINFKVEVKLIAQVFIELVEGKIVAPRPNPRIKGH